MIALSKSFLDDRALSMMSNRYFFEFHHPSYPFLNKSFSARVIAVVINEASCPELLLDSQDEHPDYYPIDQLVISSTSSSSGE